MQRRCWVLRAAALLAVYLVVDLAIADHGHLGTDTGAKVATLETMVSRGDFDFDVEYWAEDIDPDGALHPLFQTARRGDKWVAATTLPLLLAARPLYAAGGYHLALLIPAAAAVCVALLAAALARRVDAPARQVFWIVGLASPVAVYALDLWEHTLGLAAMLAAAVLSADVALGRRGPLTCGLVGVLAGVAFSVRTEAIAYGFVLVGVACVLAVARHGWARTLFGGLAAIVGLGAAVAANHALEVAVVDEGIRFSRASRLASTAGEVATSSTASSSRVGDAITTTVNIYANGNAMAWITGAFVIAALAVVASRARRTMPEQRETKLVAGAVAAIFAALFVRGLGFVPGLFAAAPLAVVAVALGWQRPTMRPVLALALVPLPLVWAVQYVGGAEPQWGGRYVLLSSVLLTVMGLAVVRELQPWARRFFIGLGVVLTALGIAWVIDRSYRVERLENAVEMLDEDLLVVSTVDHMFREAGATYSPTAPWLTAAGGDEVRRALDLVTEQLDAERFALVLHPREEDLQPRIDGYRLAERDELPTLSGDAPILVFEREASSEG